MIKKITTLLIMLILCSCARDGDEQLAVSQKTDFIIDVRSAIEYQDGHLENAINIPHDQIKERISSHVEDPESRVLLYCRSGRRSEIAQKTLLDIGYINAVNGGGIEELRSKGYQ